MRPGTRRLTLQAPASPTEIGTVLVVDDDADVLNACARILEASGMRVLTASNGREAVSIYSRQHSDIGCVLLDLTMPYMDGVDAFRELARIDPSVKVIMTSGYSEQHSASQLADLGVTAFLQKPYTLQGLLAAIGRASPSPASERD